jgi:hypothetical protein
MKKLFLNLAIAVCVGLCYSCEQERLPISPEGVEYDAEIKRFEIRDVESNPKTNNFNGYLKIIDFELHGHEYKWMYIYGMSNTGGLIHNPDCKYCK